jgi:hypothetical protein
MAEPKVIIVVLRRPNLACPDEMRTDPLWEFGSFGCTRCHTRNLMNPRKIHLLRGARLAFAQGGYEGFKLVHLTPPIEVISHSDFAEAKWSPVNMPFKYAKAPLLIHNSGSSDFPRVRRFIERANCSSWEAKFACKFRARRAALDTDIAEEIIEVFEQKANTKRADLFASTYIEALPYPPPRIDNDREQTYWQLLNYGTQGWKT